MPRTSSPSSTSGSPQSGFPDRAHDFATAIIEHCDGLAAALMLGPARDDLRPGLRTTGFRRRVVIAFAVHDDTVEILGVFYGGQDYETDLTDRDACPTGAPAQHAISTAVLMSVP